MPRGIKCLAGPSGFRPIPKSTTALNSVVFYYAAVVYFTISVAICCLISFKNSGFKVSAVVFYYRRSELLRIVNLLSVVFLVREGPLGCWLATFERIRKLEKAVAVRNSLLERFSGKCRRCWKMIPRFFRQREMLCLPRFGHFPARTTAAGKLAAPAGTQLDFLFRDRHSLLEFF